MANRELPDLYLERIDRAKNMSRYYWISLQPDLFGQITLLKSWGRIGTMGRMAVASYADTAKVMTERHRLLESKRRRGYRLTSPR